jgi:hypothetical protein
MNVGSGGMVFLSALTLVTLSSSSESSFFHSGATNRLMGFASVEVIWSQCHVGGVYTVLL